MGANIETKNPPEGNPAGQRSNLPGG